MYYFIDLEFINHATLSSTAHCRCFHIVNCTLWTIQPYWLHYQQLFQHLFFIDFFIDYSTLDTLINFSTLSTTPHYRLPHIIDFSTLSTSPHYRLCHIIDYPTLLTTPHYRRLHIIDYATLSPVPLTGEGGEVSHHELLLRAVGEELDRDDTFPYSVRNLRSCNTVMLAA